MYLLFLIKELFEGVEKFLFTPIAKGVGKVVGPTFTNILDEGITHMMGEWLEMGTECFIGQYGIKKPWEEKAGDLHMPNPAKTILEKNISIIWDKMMNYTNRLYSSRLYKTFFDDTKSLGRILQTNPILNRIQTELKDNDDYFKLIKFYGQINDFSDFVTFPPALRIERAIQQRNIKACIDRVLDAAEEEKAAAEDPEHQINIRKDMDDLVPILNGLTDCLKYFKIGNTPSNLQLPTEIQSGIVPSSNPSSSDIQVSAPAAAIPVAVGGAAAAVVPAAAAVVPAAAAVVPDPTRVPRRVDNIYQNVFNEIFDKIGKAIYNYNINLSEPDPILTKLANGVAIESQEIQQNKGILSTDYCTKIISTIQKYVVDPISQSHFGKMKINEHEHSYHNMGKTGYNLTTGVIAGIAVGEASKFTLGLGPVAGVAAGVTAAALSAATKIVVTPTMETEYSKFLDEVGTLFTAFEKESILGEAWQRLKSTCMGKLTANAVIDINRRIVYENKITESLPPMVNYLIEGRKNIKCVNRNSASSELQVLEPSVVNASSYVTEAERSPKSVFTDFGKSRPQDPMRLSNVTSSAASAGEGGGPRDKGTPAAERIAERLKKDNRLIYELKFPGEQILRSFNDNTILNVVPENLIISQDSMFDIVWLKISSPATADASSSPATSDASSSPAAAAAAASSSPAAAAASSSTAAAAASSSTAAASSSAVGVGEVEVPPVLSDKALGKLPVAAAASSSTSGGANSTAASSSAEPVYAVRPDPSAKALGKRPAAVSADHVSADPVYAAQLGYVEHFIEDQINDINYKIIQTIQTKETLHLLRTKYYGNNSFLTETIDDLKEIIGIGRSNVNCPSLTEPTPDGGLKQITFIDIITRSNNFLFRIIKPDSSYDYYKPLIRFKRDYTSFINYFAREVRGRSENRGYITLPEEFKFNDYCIYEDILVRHQDIMDLCTVTECSEEDYSGNANCTSTFIHPGRTDIVSKDDTPESRSLQLFKRPPPDANEINKRKQLLLNWTEFILHNRTLSVSKILESKNNFKYDFSISDDTLFENVIDPY